MSGNVSVNIDNKSMISRMFVTTDQLSQSKSFAQSQVATRIAAIPLVFAEITEMVTNLLHAPSEGFILLYEMAGEKVFSSDPDKKWDKDWHPLQALIKAAKIFVAIISTIVLGIFINPAWNRWVHEKLGLVPFLPVHAVAGAGEGDRKAAAAAV